MKRNPHFPFPISHFPFISQFSFFKLELDNFFVCQMSNGKFLVNGKWKLVNLTPIGSKW